MLVQRIMLVIPNAKWYQQESYWHLHPYALALLAAMLDPDRYTVKILDANIDDLSPEQFGAEVAVWAPDLVGISILANEFAITGHVGARAAKQARPEVVTVLGGVYPTTRPRDAVDDAMVDFVVIGEGEEVFPALLAYLNGEGPCPEVGLAYRKDNAFVVQERAPFIQDLDALPFPAFHLLDYRRYTTQSFKHVVDAPRALPYAKLITSRGCPIGCTFCQVEAISGKLTRYQSAKRVVDEMEWLVDAFGVKAIEFLDDNFLGNRRRAREIFGEMIRRKVPVVWNAMNVSSFYLNDELLELMRQSGCQYVSIAVESGVHRVLKDIIKKPVDLKHVKNMLDRCRALDMDTTTLWVIGSPGETWDEIRTTIRVAEEMGSDYTKINVATPYPGTELFDMAVDGGYLSPGFDFGDLAWGQATISTEEFDASELTLLRAFEWDRINFSRPERKQKIARMMGVSLGELDGIRQKTRANAMAKVLKMGRVAQNSPFRILAPSNVGDISVAVNA